jgi:hypothetical protein
MGLREAINWLKEAVLCCEKCLVHHSGDRGQRALSGFDFRRNTPCF